MTDSTVKGKAMDSKRCPELALLTSRRSFIGGSDARVIMGDDETALLRLWREKRGEVEPEDLSGNLIVQLGVVTEPLNRIWYERNTGQAVKPNFNTMIRKPEYFQSVANARRVVRTTGRGSRASSHWVDVSASASRMLGGRATPTAWKARPTSPVTGVRRMKRLPSCSVSISCSRSRSMSKAPHSDLNRAAARRSSSPLRRTSAKNEQNTWPRIAASV